MIRTLIVDDEPLAREGLRLRLAREPDVQVVGEAGSGDAAVALALEHLPDLLFLDVQMPGGDGFATLARLGEAHLPLVVFVTAFDAHAVRAFEAHALDYLLKPVQDARLSEAIRRARVELSCEGGPGARDRIAALLEPEGETLTRFVVRDRGRCRLVPAADVRWIATAANYLELHTGNGTCLVRMTLAEAARRLPGFARIHRTTLVRADLVRSIEPNGQGDFRVRLDDGHELTLSRRYRGALAPGSRIRTSTDQPGSPQ